MSRVRMLGYGVVRAVELMAAFATAFGIALALIGWLGGPLDPVHGGVPLFLYGVMLAVPGSIAWLVAYLARRAVTRSSRSSPLPVRQN
jgi:hypothetical protein